MISRTGFPTGQLAGTTVASYKILQPVGFGGMGEVYRGWDDKLGRPVAIKVLHPALATDERARERFLRETRVACRVVHPYVATVFDVLEKDERLFLVMEYIEGRRLDAVVDEDNPAAQEIARLGLEIAEALAAIHDSGVVHRDLKPGNVMVTPAGHVKVMDFGVAYPMRPLQSEPTLTQDGHGVGTVTYMSPEQIGQRSVDTRSDLFSLGIVLYEALARQHPFQRGSVPATISAILNEPPGAGSEEPKTLTEAGALRTIVFRLLEKSPALRYQSSAEVVADLRAALEGRPLVISSRRKVRAVSITTAAVVVAAAAAGGAWWWSHRPPAEGGLSLRPVIAILPFEDRTGEPDGALRAGMLSDLVSTSLAASDTFRPLGADRIEAMTGPATEADLARERRAAFDIGDARWVVGGRLHREGEILVATVEVRGPGDDGPFAAFTASAAGLLGVSDRVTRTLAEKLGGPAPADPSRAAIWFARTTDQKALMLVARGRRAFKEFRIDDAIAAFEEAVKLEPAMIAAHLGLANALNVAGYGVRADAEAAAARLLVDQAAASLDPEVRLSVEATTAAVADRLTEEAKARTLLADRRPDDPELRTAVAEVLVKQGRVEEALAQAEAARALDPSDPRVFVARASALSALGRHQEADVALDAADALFRRAGNALGRAWIDEERGHVARRAGKLRDAESLYGRAFEAFEKARQPGFAVRALANRADAQLLEGHIAEASETYRASGDRARPLGLRRLLVDGANSLGAALFAQGSMEEAERLFREARREARAVDSPSLLLPATLNLASLLAYTLSTAEARGLAEEGLAIARQRGDGDREVMALTLLAAIHATDGAVEKARNIYADVATRRRASGGSALVWALAGLSETSEALADYDGAELSAKDAVEAAERAHIQLEEGYARLRQGLVAARLGRFDEAEDGFRRARKIAAESQAGLADLTLRADEGSGYALALSGDAAQASRKLRDLVETALKAGNASAAGRARVDLACALLLAGNGAAARPLAEEALAGKDLDAFDRVRARVALASALADERAWNDAAAAARRAIEEADASSLPEPAVFAAGVLASLPAEVAPPSLQERREDARRRFDRLLLIVPEPRRKAFLRRADVAGLARRLGVTS